jgi:hypothetical protein
MRAALQALLAASAFAGGCASPYRSQTLPGPAGVGAPGAPFDPALLTRGPAPADTQSEREPVRLPERIFLPASYRLVLLEGQLVLVRETDPKALLQAPASLRILAGEIARGELGYQPGLLPQELAAEVAANRESSARMDNALEAVMRRSRELSEQALELQAQSRRLAELLAAAQARVQELEAGGAQQAKPPTTQPEPKGQQD